MLPISKINPVFAKEILAEIENNPHLLKLQDTAKTKRKTCSFGYDYFTLLDGDKTFTPIPYYLEKLCKISIASFPEKYNLGDYKNYLNVIVSFYENGYQLEPHIDVDMTDRFSDGKKTDFYFGEHVIGVVLQADETGRFYISKEDEVMEVDEAVGTTFLLTGELRRKPYYHGVNVVTHSRISVTFRTVMFVTSHQP